MVAKVVQSATANENCQLSIAIGDEIRDTTYLEGLESSFENTRVRIRGNMTRMMRMADSTGVGWKVWLGFFFAVFLLFFYVWIF
jgi:blocked-early-in-transport protein 1